MATLKEFEEALRDAGMSNALAILDTLKKRDREARSIAPARRVVGRKMTSDLARTILEMHASTAMTQQEIAFKLGVNQGRVNEVIKRGKWLNNDPSAPEALSRDKAMARLATRAKARRSERPTAEPSAAPERDRVPTQATAEAQPVAVSVSPALHKAHPALPLEQPVAVRLAKPGEAARASVKKPNPLPTPIVSAQLAFLDL